MYRMKNAPTYLGALDLCFLYFIICLITNYPIMRKLIFSLRNPPNVTIYAIVPDGGLAYQEIPFIFRLIPI
jgi:hypothetical protein